ncbi:MAG: polysaccharide deacetylase family protein [Sedimentisphaerales bacterium]|nr:polysaccharide deacetylase family protein [Sedimentisphaerales bacterium]
MFYQHIKSTFFFVLFTGTGVLFAQEPTYAERLGWPTGSKVVLFHVDDVGMSYSSNRGAIRAIEEGMATSMSVMMPCPWVSQFRDYYKNHSDIDVGVHLTLNAEWKNYRWGPVAGQSIVPGLVDPEGYLWRKVKDTLFHTSADEFEAEIRAQVDKAMAMGIVPSHLDSHMGTCFLPGFIDRYVKVGIEKNIPVLIFDGHMQHIGAEAGAFRPLLHTLAQQVWDANLPVIDDLVTSPTDAKEYPQRKEQLLRLLEKMKPGITQIIVHCTDPTEAFSQISGSGDKRKAELQLMIDPDVKTFIQDKGIIPTTWRELKQRRQKSLR